MHMYPHSLTEDKCLSLRLFKPLKQHSASTPKRLKTAFQKTPDHRGTDLLPGKPPWTIAAPVFPSGYLHS